MEGYIASLTLGNQVWHTTAQMDKVFGSSERKLIMRSQTSIGRTDPYGSFVEEQMEGVREPVLWELSEHTGKANGVFTYLKVNKGLGFDLRTCGVRFEKEWATDPHGADMKRIEPPENILVVDTSQ